MRQLHGFLSVRVDRQFSKQKLINQLFPMCHKRLVSLFVLFSLTHRSNSQHTSEEIIAYVNSHASTWTVGINPDNPALDSLRFLDPNISLLYTKDEMKIMSHRQEYVSRLPEEFNALDKWPMCRNVIARVRNQGKCQSCWVRQRQLNRPKSYLVQSRQCKLLLLFLTESASEASEGSNSMPPQKM